MTEAASQRRPRVALAALAAGAGAAAAAFALAESEWLNLTVDLSPALLAAVPVALLVIVAMARRPEVGLHALIILAYGNLSEVLVRQGLPSALQLLVPVLLLVLTWAAVREASASALSRPPREILLFTLASALFVGWTWLSTAWSVEPERALAATGHVAKAALLAVVVAAVVQQAERLRRIAWTLLIVGAVLSALSSWQVLTGGWEHDFLGLTRVKHAHIAGHVFKPRASGPLADPNFYAQMLLPLVPVGIALAIGRGRAGIRLAALGLAGIVALGVVTTYSRGGALALAVALGLFAVLERRRVAPRHVLLAIALAAAAIPALPGAFWSRLGTLEVLLPVEEEGLQSHDSSVAKRQLVMGAAALMALDHPMVGVGAGNYTTHFHFHADRIGAEGRVYNLVGEEAYAHSLYLELLAELGLVGFTCFGVVAGIALLAARSARRAFASAGNEDAALLARAIALGLVAMLISSLILHGDYPRYLWMVMGLCAGTAGAAARARIGTAP